MKNKSFNHVNENVKRREITPAEMKRFMAMEQKVVALLRQLENDDEFMAYTHKFPELHYGRTIPGAFSFVVAIKSALYAPSASWEPSVSNAPTPISSSWVSQSL